nr:tRNA (guanine-N1)-methyltransferase [Desulfurobacterium thermolithotrophum]
MRFKTPKELVATRLKEAGFRRPKLLFHPKRGDIFNRIAYGLVKGKFGIFTEKEIGEELLPGCKVDECYEIKLLAFMGDEKPDSAIVRGRKGIVNFSDIDFEYPLIAVDLSFYNKLLPREKKSLLNQIEITYGVVKDFFTPENFVLTSVSNEARKELEKFFTPYIPFSILDKPEQKEIIVLDPYGDKDFTHEEITPQTLIIVGGIVDSGERMIGSTKEIFPNVKHRKISYKGSIELVPDRINDIVKIVCQYLTEDISLSEAVRQNITRTAKLKWLRKALEKNLVRFSLKGKILRGIPEKLYKQWKEEFELTDFHFKKGAKHIGGFFVFKSTLFEKVEGKILKRKKEIFLLKELKNEDVVKVYS